MDGKGPERGSKKIRGKCGKKRNAKLKANDAANEKESWGGSIKVIYFEINNSERIRRPREETREQVGGRPRVRSSERTTGIGKGEGGRKRNSL